MREGCHAAETASTGVTLATAGELSPHQTHRPVCYLNARVQECQRTGIHYHAAIAQAKLVPLSLLSGTELTAGTWQYKHPQEWVSRG